MPLCWNCYDNHTSLECDTLKKLQLPASFLLDNFDVVTPLRVLLLFYRYAEQRKMNACVDADLKSQIDEILSMESHCIKRKDSWIWKQHQKNTVEPLHSINIDGIFKSMDAPWHLSDQFLQKICGILDVNTFEVRTEHFEVCLHNYTSYFCCAQFFAIFASPRISIYAYTFLGVSCTWSLCTSGSFGTRLYWKHFYYR